MTFFPNGTRTETRSYEDYSKPDGSSGYILPSQVGVLERHHYSGETSALVRFPGAKAESEDRVVEIWSGRLAFYPVQQHLGFMEQL